MHAYSGLLRIVTLAPPPKARRSSKAGAKAEPVPDAAPLDLTRGYSIRLPNLNITNLAFLPSPTDAPPAIACLSADHLGRRVLDSYQVDLAEKELVPGPMDTVVLDDPGSEIFIPVGGDEGLEGVLVVGEESVRWVSVAGAADGGSKGKGKAGAPTQVTCQLPVGLVQAYALNLFGWSGGNSCCSFQMDRRRWLARLVPPR